MPALPLAVGVIGCGDVALTRYLPYLAHASSLVAIVALADLDPNRSRSAADSFRLAARSPAQIIAAPDVDIVLNLTPPLAHAELNAAALEHGKHVYSEKPYATTLAVGLELNRLASRVNRRLASAPDTILGPNIQLARRLISEGKIGTPYMASMSFVTADRSWHPDPAFFYQEGAGPIFDEGPYFLSSLVALLGPIREAFARAATFRDAIPIAGPGAPAAVVRPQVPTSFAGGLVLHSGALVSMLMSFDVRGSTLPPLEIYGEEGTLRLVFPGYYNGPVLFGTEHDRITEVIHPSWTTAADEARGIGVEELAHAITTGGPSRLEGEFPLHILEAMEAITTAAKTGETATLSTRAAPPGPYDPAENPRNRILPAPWST